MKIAANIQTTCYKILAGKYREVAANTQFAASSESNCKYRKVAANTDHVLLHIRRDWVRGRVTLKGVSMGQRPGYTGRGINRSEAGLHWKGYQLSIYC